MKLSSKALACGQSPMRKFHPYAVAAAAAGRKIYHLNIGQPDIHTPDALYDAIHNFRTPVLAYAASPGIPELISAIEGYYRNIGVQLSESDILVTTGGSEALQIAANCLLDDGDEVIVPEPFYPNYHTFITTAGGVIHPLHTRPAMTLHRPAQYWTVCAMSASFSLSVMVEASPVVPQTTMASTPAASCRSSSRFMTGKSIVP